MKRFMRGVMRLGRRLMWAVAVGWGLPAAIWAAAQATAAPAQPATASLVVSSIAPPSVAQAVSPAVSAGKAPALAAGGAYTVNVPLLEVPAGDPGLDANFWAVVWLGEVSGKTGAYADVRLVGRTDGLLLRGQVYDAEVADDDALTLAINGRRWRVPYGDKAGAAAKDATDGGVAWEISERCGAEGCRGWGVDALIPWAELGGPPQAGDAWPLRVRLDDRGVAGSDRQATPRALRPPAAWPPEGSGVLRWGLPGEGGETGATEGTTAAVEGIESETFAAEGVEMLEVSLSADSMVGGGTDCGVDDYPEYFPTWGSRNFGGSPHANVQMQWDIADWPCYAKYYAAWGLGELPQGAEILTATLELRQFGNPGYGPGYAEDGTKDTVIQVYEVRKVWEEDAITWDNAPVPHENVARTLVRPLPGDCAPTPYWYCDPGIPYAFDVSEIVRRAQAGERTWASAVLYTAAGQYHAGKFFWSREGQEPPVVRIVYRVGEGGAPLRLTHYLPGRLSGLAVVAPGVAGAGGAGFDAALGAVVTNAGVVTGTLGGMRAAMPRRTYYVALRGNDDNPGSQLRPWKTFGRAWETLLPGDTLIVGDGRYTEPLQPNVRNGEPGRPITIKAQHDGAVTIDGQGQVVPVKLGDNWGAGGPFGDWYVLEGVVVRNGVDHVLEVRGSHNVVRRVSVYDGDVNDNTVNLLLWGNDNLVEDCVVSGTGRYMINVYNSSGNTLRRCFTMWRQWEGRHFCGVTWPNGNNIGVYGASDTTVENSIAYGRALTGIFIQANADEAVANNNQVLGSMALLQGRDLDGSQWQYGASEQQPQRRPGPTANRFGGAACDDAVTQWEWGNFRQGFSLWGQGELRDNVFRDVLAAGNVGMGWGSGHPSGPGPQNLVLDHMTLYDNGADVPAWEGQQGGNIYIDRRDELLGSGALRVTNSRIANSEWANQGEGARLQHRYVNRQLTNQPLLPWPMEGRIRKELGVSVGAIVEEYVQD